MEGSNLFVELDAAEQPWLTAEEADVAQAQIAVTAPGVVGTAPPANSAI